MHDFKNKLKEVIHIEERNIGTYEKVEEGYNNNKYIVNNILYMINKNN